MTPGQSPKAGSIQVVRVPGSSLNRLIWQDRAMTSVETFGREPRFACTSCGACCNRPPEVELSEAAALADVFVFRLMFRLYQLPRLHAGCRDGQGPDAFYETKRLLTAFAARKYAAKRRDGGRIVEVTKYLTISALALDVGAGACAALSGGRCDIYARRPLACRTVPFHYSRPEASAGSDLAAFVATPGYRCDVTPGAPVVLAGGRIVDDQSRQARLDALALAGHDRPWKDAILRRMKSGSGTDHPPSLREVEANAPFGATTVSMRVAWQVAVEAGLLAADACTALIAAQAAVIDRTLAAADGPAGARETLGEMRTEYRALLTA
jgi:Fe-S-cluster containining protein